MICLTGDVHHSALNTDDSRFCEGTEIEAALKMSQIAGKYGLNITMFFTGLCAKEAPDLISEIARMDHVEIAGHNYFAYKSRKLFNAYAKITGLRNGPYFYQRWEVKKTVEILSKTGKQTITSWRNHAYRHDRHTRKILRNNDILYFSDMLSNNFAQPKWNEGIIDVPINTIPDHDYVYHGRRQPGTFDEEQLLKSTFKIKPMPKEKWLELIKDQVTYIESKNGVATILAHPACMSIIDKFNTFEKLCGFLADFKSVKMREISL